MSNDNVVIRKYSVSQRPLGEGIFECREVGRFLVGRQKLARRVESLLAVFRMPSGEQDMVEHNMVCGGEEESIGSRGGGGGLIEGACRLRRRKRSAGTRSARFPTVGLRGRGQPAPYPYIVVGAVSGQSCFSWDARNSE